MKLIEIFQQLSDGELSQVSLGGGEYRDINPRDYPRVGQAVNLALNALHKRFFLRDGEVTVQLHPTIQTYVLSKDYAASNQRSNEPVKYLLDTARPFEDGVLKIEAVYDEDGKALPLNMLGKPDSIRTLDYRTMVIPEVTETGITRRVTYRKDHRKLGERDWEDPERTEIDLPYSHLEALLYYVASRLLTPLGADSTGSHVGNSYAKRYEQEARRLEGQGLEINRDYGAEKFSNRGWV